MDIYSEITNRIVSEMEKGVIPWQKSWIASGQCVSYATGKPYSLLNQMILGKPGEYLTFNECRKAGGFIRKGEKASIVVFWKWIETEDEEAIGRERLSARLAGAIPKDLPRVAATQSGAAGQRRKFPSSATTMSFTSASAKTSSPGAKSFPRSTPKQTRPLKASFKATPRAKASGSITAKETALSTVRQTTASPFPR